MRCPSFHALFCQRSFRWLCWVTLVLSCLTGRGELPAAASRPIDFVKDIQPIFATHCYECHGGKRQKNNLRLDNKASALKGGDFGPEWIAGNSAGSHLIQLVAGLVEDKIMPAKGERLTANEIGLLRAWIDQGAVWPDGVDLVTLPNRTNHWAFKSVVRPSVPVAKNSRWGINPIDAFILARLEKESFGPSVEADRRTLIRRLSFDLLGLPPSPEEVESFVQDKRKDAYERLVDRYLASPHYGEYWARHWLDVAHYADTHGFERDQRRDNAWPYRDYVIRSLSEDKPYNQFIREQIAGDIIAPTNADAVIATGFLAAGPWDFVGQVETRSDMLRRAARADDLDDMVTAVMTSTIGLTVNCARCHDHKIDPILQSEYYGLWAVFAGVKRGERDISVAEAQAYTNQLKSIERDLREVNATIAHLEGKPISLADIAGGGNGAGTGQNGLGIDPRNGKPSPDKLGYLDNIRSNIFVRTTSPFVDGVVIPDGGRDGRTPVPVSSTGLQVTDVPATSAKAWDAIRNGPVNSQFSTELDGVNYDSKGHSLLGLHANVAITFDLNALRQTNGWQNTRFQATAGYGGKLEMKGADIRIYLDGRIALLRAGIGRNDGAIAIDLPISTEIRFLTLMVTDGGNGIAHDQVFFGDAKLVRDDKRQPVEGDRAELTRLKSQRDGLEKARKELKIPAKVYAILTEPPPVVHVLRRGDPEAPDKAAPPAAIGCLAGMNAPLGNEATAEGQRRLALADWIVDPKNPLTRRVIMNRLWHYHFGVGIVDTPSDFGLGGGKPSHPELLDWLAEEFATRGWSLKAMHRLIVTSATYRQQSIWNEKAARVDAGNRLLWRMNPRRLEAEALRDAVLSVSGTLNEATGGPGFHDFDYTEGYAPVYRYITADSPELCRRTIYRFTVRSTPDQFMNTLDCPNPSNLTPARIATTTALQSLALLNNDFMLKQANHLADRITRETGPSAEKQIDRAFALTLARSPSRTEKSAALRLVQREGLFHLCRMLYNANEFVYVD